MAEDTKPAKGARYALYKEKGWTRYDHDKKAIAKARELKDWPLLMTQTELAGILGVQSKTVSEMRKRGLGPDWFTTTGTRIYYKKEDVMRWFDECKKDNQLYLDECHQWGKGNGQLQRAKKRFYAKEIKDRPKKSKQKPKTVSPHLVFRDEKES